MIDIPMRSSQSLDSNTILRINHSAKYQTAQNINNWKPIQNNVTPTPPNRTPIQTPVEQPAVSIPVLAVPPLLKKIQKGQKVPLSSSGSVRHIKVCLGWNVKNPRCDLDVSAFILGANGKVLGDDWFVFYGQESSPDQSVHFSLSTQTDREYISVDFSRLNPTAQKIVFVLTINDAFVHNLNFSMVKDAYIRILNADTQQELVSFQMTDYYPNVISMMIGEIYLYQGIWKCSAVGNGVAKDLAGLCELYGVQVM
ncbi:MAG: TerD family protein [Lachnospiraceae bacterium]|jgi:tellurium resistance protein TerD|nr:TerD family protein [Lachnospiraceae bacterium]